MSDQAQSYQPLADRMRPQKLDQVVGQSHLTAAGKPLSAMLAHGRLYSVVFWGPPGTGKTTLARLLSQGNHTQFIALSAVLAGVKDIRQAVEKAGEHTGQTVIFVDEIHRFNKSQQDAFLPHVESGLVTLIGATTENPSFSLNNALLSRVRVLVLKSLSDDDLLELIDRALADNNYGLKHLQGSLSQSQKQSLLVAADGDARRLLGLLEQLADIFENGNLDNKAVEMLTAGQRRRFDNKGDIFYEQISALHKTIRSSNPDAALYWLARMLDAGCDPAFLGRRLLRMASEDIGNADPRAMTLCLHAWQTYERLGSPEGDLALAQAVTYLACCPKSNAVYSAFKLAQKDAVNYGSLAVPKHLCNAPTQMMKKMGYGEGYQYDHNYQDGVAHQQMGFPEKLGEQIYYQPKQVGLEVKIANKIAQIREKRLGGEDD